MKQEESQEEVDEMGAPIPNRRVRRVTKVRSFNMGGRGEEEYLILKIIMFAPNTNI